MSELGPGQKPNIRNRYPHMMPEDVAVWSKFLRQTAGGILECWYDLRVGQSVQIGLGASDMAKRIASQLTRKRIDVVCRVREGYWVVEVKPHANMYAVGQVLSYVRLFAKEFEVSGEITPVLVCDSFDEDLIDEFDEFGILVLTNH